MELYSSKSHRWTNLIDQSTVWLDAGGHVIRPVVTSPVAPPLVHQAAAVEDHLNLAPESQLKHRNGVRQPIPTGCRTDLDMQMSTMINGIF